ncbi:MAG: hypothetical protein GY898_04135 [Proteobacteria bacterium]|nr:hypothetical protein [Pseudomonadota bacterium]
MDRTRECLLLLMRPYEGAPRAPGSYPFGRAMQALADEGLRVVVGHEVQDGRATGWALQKDAWVRVEGVPIAAVHDRLAGEPWAALRTRLLAEIPAGVPVANPEAVRAICRDKLATHRFLEAAGVPLPAITTDPAVHADWGAGYLKRRLGSKGEGVWRVGPGDDLGAGDFVQKAIDPEPGEARVALRLLAQRLPDRTWRLNPAVARIAAAGADVVNVHSGARAARAAAVCDVGELNALAARTTAAFTDPHAVELGLDFVLDAERRPWLIEVNSVPRGRLGALAKLDPDAFDQAHVDACARPLRTLAAWAG